jgi:hypothetical protein
MTDYISIPRPTYDKDNDPKSEVRPKRKSQRLECGSQSGGVILEITKKGIYFNGYYLGFHKNPPKFACLNKPGFISWEDIEKAKIKLERKTKKRHKKKVEEADFMDVPSQEYLDSLPQVTLGNAKYYIDADRRERRAVNNPGKVFKF